MKKTNTLGFLLILFITPNIYAQSFDCDDFSDSLEWPEISIPSLDIDLGDTIGYTQSGTQTVTFGPHTDDYLPFNSYHGFGLFSGGTTINFSFDGSDQLARFHLGESNLGPTTGRTFSVNGSVYTLMDGIFPMVVDGITVDLDTSSAPDLESYYSVYLTFSGTLSEVSLRAEDFHESSIVELCIESLLDGEGCDDFTDVTTNPEAFYSAEEIIGYSQDESQPITCGDEGSVWVNNSNPGIYGVGPVNFSFDGSSQTARFEAYGFLTQFNEMGFSVNGSPLVYLDDSFPMSVSGVAVNLDLSPPNWDGWEYFYLTFNGEIDVISHKLFESAITELCVENLSDIDDSGIEDLNQSHISIYPNPASNFIRIETQENIAQVSIYAMSGQEMMKQFVEETEVELNLSELVPGMYLIKITEQNGSETIEKLIRK